MSTLRLSVLLYVPVNLPDPVSGLLSHGVDGDFPRRVLYPSLPPEREFVDLPYLGINGGQVEQDVAGESYHPPGNRHVKSRDFLQKIKGRDKKYPVPIGLLPVECSLQVRQQVLFTA